MNKSRLYLEKKRNLNNIKVNLFENYFSRTSVIPHCLIELTRQELGQYESNIIHLSGLNSSPEMSYDNMTFGNNIHWKNIYEDDNSVCYKYINLEKMAGNYCLITTDKKECCKYDKNTIFIGSNDLYGGVCSPSDVVVLGLLTLDRNCSSLDRKVWSEYDHYLLSKCKPNILTTSNNHHNSNGYYYGFGNRGNYRTIDNSSVTTYVNKSSKSLEKQSLINQQANELEKLIGAEVMNGIQSLKKRFPLITNFISPILQSTETIKQHNNEILSLHDTVTSHCGCWHSTCCVNAETQVCHTEKDVTYSIITVPCQEVNDSRYNFLLRINPQCNLVTNLRQGTNLFYSAYYLGHWQRSMNMGGNHTFVNICSYGSRRLFSHLRCTLQRQGVL